MNGSSPRLNVCQVWNTRSPSRRKTLTEWISSSSTVAPKSSLKVDGAEDTQGSVQRMRSRNSSSFGNGARETSTNDVSFAWRCDSGPMWSAIALPRRYHLHVA